MARRWGWQNVLLILSCNCLGCFNGFTVIPTNVHTPLEESVVKPAQRWTTHRVAIIDVNGMILNARKSGLLSDGENPVALFREKLERAAEDASVKAVVLRINSPGGGVTASDIMYRDLIAFKAKTQKPVVACFMDVAASGGYYLAMAADQIYAHPTTITGSIGVIMSLYNAEDLCKKLGVASDAIKSGPNKDIGNPTRKLTPEERAIMQGMVDQFYDRFVAVVAAGRQLPETQVRAIADGRVYSAAQAKEMKLIDEIGYLDDALRRAKELAGIADAKVIAYDRTARDGSTIYAATPRIPSEISVKLEVPGLNLLNHPGATFLYLWHPGGLD
jgi:protease-4